MMMRTLFVALLVFTLAACGFHLRGQESYTLPFQTVYVDGDAASAVVVQIKRAIQLAGASFSEKPGDAQAVLQILPEGRERVVQSLSGAGKVSEYQLRLRVSFRLTDGKEKELIPLTEIALNRNFAFDDAQILAKEAEENLLYRDMQSDAAQQIMRRVSAVGK
jgi:LPS-assembly lipoprotein